MKIDRFLHRRLVYLFAVCCGMVYLFVVGSVEISNGDDLDSSKFSSSSVHAITVSAYFFLLFP
ncbi:hypothetical protein HA466_0117270 [Hirschfeldia incana]|nr:hypothetical protein HA466_0117270 [Hirschfeldia incana]KAJ0252543.1 hypothetical protein HA466_0117270 [Hirschfeldia incana]KAJ0252544.1 hypothetical protein HA466_0117270 [Hirschfeldia incana]